MDIVNEYNQELDKQPSPEEDDIDGLLSDEEIEPTKNKQVSFLQQPPAAKHDDEGLHRTMSGSLTRDTLLKSLEEKDKMLSEFKHNTDTYVSSLKARIASLEKQISETDQ